MVDRTDLDALLIGALYGELTPAEEARLTAHLESHPADRTALDNLTRTRAAVRDSRILAFQFEPPQVISALLLQEASRRAPRAATAERSETASWFQRFVHSFMAHPAMAAAATLVLVIGVAGSLYLRGADQFAKSEPPPAAERAPAAVTTTSGTTPGTPAPVAAAPAALAPEPEAAGGGNAPGSAIGAPAGSSGGSAADSDLFRARLDEKAAAQPVAAEPQAVAPTAGDRLEERADPYARAPYKKAETKAKGAGRDAALPRPEATERPPARASKADAVRGIELRTPQLMPKDLKESKESDDDKLASRREMGGGRAAGDAARNQRGVGPGVVAPATPSAAPAPPPPAPAAAPRAADPASALNLAPEQAAQANEGKRPAAKPPVKLSPPPAANAQNAQVDHRADKTANAANADASKQAQTDGRSARDRTLLEWARKHHEQVIALVGANRCRDAASAAVEIYNRAPDYYNANIATDRQIRPCLAYVNDQRERADRSRAAKNAANAADVQAPAQAAPPRN